ncbi:Armadillo-type_fold [Hexamita inflata]|uniref:Armadillo-type fold n=1 Tax=Hexamita inflata TaxID=28002 RepID=A0AA86U9H7_9EUKA|nr:Armadillo-type fold [Hexamita inflata]
MKRTIFLSQKSVKKVQDEESSDLQSDHESLAEYKILSADEVRQVQYELYQMISGQSQSDQSRLIELLTNLRQNIQFIDPVQTQKDLLPVLLQYLSQNYTSLLCYHVLYILQQIYLSFNLTPSPDLFEQYFCFLDQPDYIDLVSSLINNSIQNIKLLHGELDYDSKIELEQMLDMEPKLQRIKQYVQNHIKTVISLSTTDQKLFTNLINALRVNYNMDLEIDQIMIEWFLELTPHHWTVAKQIIKYFSPACTEDQFELISRRVFNLVRSHRLNTELYKLYIDLVMNHLLLKDEEDESEEQNEPEPDPLITELVDTYIMNYYEDVQKMLRLTIASENHQLKETSTELFLRLIEEASDATVKFMVDSIHTELFQIIAKNIKSLNEIVQFYAMSIIRLIIYQNFEMPLENVNILQNVEITELNIGAYGRLLQALVYAYHKRSEYSFEDELTKLETAGMQWPHEICQEIFGEQ